MDIGSANGLDKLIQLTHNIRNWNMFGQSLLPQLQIVILAHQKFQQPISVICKDFQAQQIYSSEKQSRNQMIQASQFEKVQKKDEVKPLYCLFKLRNKIKGSLHMIQGLSDNEIRDEEFRRRREMIDKFSRNKSSIFIVFDLNEYQMLLRSQKCLNEFGFTQNVNKFILFTINSSKWELYNRILLKYEEIFKYDIVNNYQLMKSSRKQLDKQLSRFIKWKQLLDNKVNPDSYALFMFKNYTDMMKSSFSGTYSSTIEMEDSGFGKTIHWKVSELLAGFWGIQGDLLFKCVDGMSLKYIEQQYKMSDYYSIGGFLPDTCFKEIFSPPLHTFQESLQQMIETITTQVLEHIEAAITYIFKNTTVLDKFVQTEINKIQQVICENFMREFQSSLTSQIQYIYATPDEFWNYRQLNSNFYTPEQQVYLEIKYIGKAYVRRVFDRIRQNTPRMIYQNLLRKIVAYLNTGSFDTYLSILRETKFQIQIERDELRNYEEKNRKLKELQGIIKFFSLKVSSPILIKKFHEKKKKDWDRMFGKDEELVEREQVENRKREEKGGFLGWMRNIFKGEKKSRQKRSRSLQKSEREVKEDFEKPKEEERKSLDQKHWLLIINVGKEIPENRLFENAAQGFPPRLRASIWMYLASKSNVFHEHVKLNVLLSSQEAKPEVKRQIQKDVLRTPPPQIFKYSLKQSLTRVLQAYSLYDKQLQYTQGMNFLTSILLLTLTNYQQPKTAYSDGVIDHKEVEEKAFILLKYLMKVKGVRKIMSVNPQLISEISLRLQTRIQQLSPPSLQCINSSLFNCQMIFSSPILSCLSGIPSDFKLKKRIMDLLMTHDIYIVHKIIAQFVSASESLLVEMNSDLIYDYFRGKMYDEVYGRVGEKGLTMMFQNL